MQACTQAPISPAPMVISRTCLPVAPCALPAQRPRVNGDLLKSLDAARAAWAACAATVDTVIDCQSKALSSPGPDHE
ncbi:Rz1-like lysis system protein LysC [Paraburkholderia lycopersici]|uniref:Rz1-like lysis system protein LysC n=1 Tax=Paraburkholderia lycopersici TaxID=416944 RepID=UPI001FDED9C8|nr:Rz1-like lysis system protein LysC [Paraburkholderia lycopersici]